jgi:L-fuconolactonase
MSGQAPRAPQRIDAHQHFWRPARGDYGWLRPDVPALAPICRDVLPAELQPLLARHGVRHTVLVQAAASTAETDFLLSLATTHDFIGGVVGWVDLSDPACVPQLERWALDPQYQGRFKGVRPMLQDLPDAHWIATAPHPQVMAALLRLNLSLDALVQPWHLAPLLRFVDRWPDLPVVVDHAAKPQLARGWQADGDAAWAEAWRSGLGALAERPQVLCKLSGLLTEAGGAARAGGRAGVEALRPVWLELLDHFGPDWLMWGSDWPVLNLASDYDAWVAVSEALLAELPDEADRQRIRCDNAQRFYALPGGDNGG